MGQGSRDRVIKGTVGSLEKIWSCVYGLAAPTVWEDEQHAPESQSRIVLQIVVPLFVISRVGDEMNNDGAINASKS
jgi:hypothetical protein